MPQPDPLPDQLFLLAVDPAKERLSTRSDLGYILRAALLVELQLGGHLSDEKGRPVAVRTTGVTDPLLLTALEQIAGGRRHRWSYWVRKDARQTIWAIQNRLAQQGRVTVESYRLLGILPARRIRIVDPLARSRLLGLIDSALSDPVRTTAQAAALVALAANGDLKAALPRAKRRAHHQRIAELTNLAGPIPKALKAVRDADAAAASG